MIKVWKQGGARTFQLEHTNNRQKGSNKDKWQFTSLLVLNNNFSKLGEIDNCIERVGSRESNWSQGSGDQPDIFKWAVALSTNIYVYSFLFDQGFGTIP